MRYVLTLSSPVLSYFSHTTQLVSVISTDDETDHDPHPIATKAPRLVKVKVKAEKSEKLPAVTQKGKGAAKSSRMSAHKVRVTDLPRFAQGKWRKTFLPTLYDKFFTSNEPFDDFTKGSDEFVALLQATIEDVFPEVEYGVTSTESIHFLVSI